MKNRRAVVGVAIFLILAVLAIMNDASPAFHSKVTSNAGIRVELEPKDKKFANASNVFRAVENNKASNTGKKDFDAPEYKNYSEMEKNRDLSRAYLFEISRNTNDHKLRENLKKAFAEGLISQNEYYGELAHMLSVSSLESFEIFQEISKSNNAYGVEVMFASLANNDVWLKELSDSERSSVLTQLSDLKPKFSGDMSALGMSDVYRYDHWVKSIENAYGGANFNAFLAKNIVEKAAEPREFLALTYGGYIDRLKSERYPVVNFVDRVIADYRRSYPNNDSANIILRKN